MGHAGSEGEAPVCRIRRSGKLFYCRNLLGKTMVFRDRVDAGVFLGAVLAYLDLVDDETVIYGLAAGGIPVAYGVAKTVSRPLDIVLVKKITYPWTSEAGFGAVALSGDHVYDRDAAKTLGYSRDDVARIAEQLRGYVMRRTIRLRGSLDYSIACGRRVVLVDDGVATGYTMLEAIRFLRSQGAHVAVATAPTACWDGLALVAREAERIVALNIRSAPFAVADAYREWHDVSDEEAIEFINRAKRRGLWLLGSGAG